MIVPVIELDGVDGVERLRAPTREYRGREFGRDAGGATQAVRAGLFASAGNGQSTIK